MKRSFLIVFAFVLAVLSTAAVFAQDVVADVVTNPFPWTEVIIAGAAALSPILIWLIKKIPLELIPTGLLPYVATGLGTVLTQVTAWQQNVELSIWASLGLGLAGVGLRELIDRAIKANAARAARKLTESTIP